MASETVYLDSLDGFGFEQVCGRMFERAGWGEVERIGGVADRGRDLIIHKPDGGRIVVECKFYGGSTVGRPVVQKLHSAVIDSRADGGIIATTGKFSKAAIEYAADLTDRHDHPIELFDMHRIMDLAHQADIELVTGRMQKIYTYPALEDHRAAAEMHGRADGLASHPAPVRDLLRVTDVGATMGAMYLVSVSIQQTFSTSVGVIHRINVDGEPHMVDGSTGELVEFGIGDFFHNPSVDASVRAGMAEHVRRKSGFMLDETTLRERITKAMVAKYTRRVVYRGRNNSTYRKNCVPSGRNIHLVNLRQVYVPYYSVTAKALDREYTCTMLHNGIKTVATHQTWRKCYACANRDASLICNECGRVAHESRFGSHGHRCRKCGKTVCGVCVWSARRFLVSLGRFCSDCRPDKARRSGER